ncbi:UNVERIFIED_CONTAM: hypothetical protein FKN15_019724 [Acipenser sinensis]
MTDDEEAEAPSFSEDERVTFVGNRLCQSFKMKVDKWDKYITVDENQKALADFFEKDTNDFLVFNITPAGLLISSQEVPANLKNKSVYMIKKRADIIILSDNYKKDLLFGEVSVTLLGQMTDVLEKVLLPVLSNKNNHQKWPHFISQDVNRHVENLKSKVSVVKGQVIGRTVLPIPAITDRIRDVQEDCIKQDHYDGTVVHSIESMVISWTHQIRDVLKEDSAQPLLQGLNPGPRTELDFWKARLENMLSIYEQLQSPVVRKIAKILETSESSYYPTFKETFKDVEEGLVEAQDVELHLRPLHRYVDLLLEEEFPQTQTLIPPLFHTICLIWTHSKFYSFPARIVVLLQEFCNVLIDQAIIYLSPEELLKGETEETLEHVQVTVNLFKAFKEAFACHRDRLSSFVPDGMEFKPWDFHSQMVFARFHRFLARLLEVEEFEYDYHVFKEKILDLDRRLATILYLAFKDCSGLESAFKLVAVFGCFLERPVVKEIFSPNYRVLLQMFNLELDRCKQLYDTHVQMEKGVKVVNKNMPATSGSLQWAKELKERIQTPWSNFKFIHHPSVEGAEVGVVYQKYLEMLTLLDEYEEQVYSGWTCGVDEVCQFNLDQPLIKRESHSGLLFVNFDPKLVGVLREVKYLHMLNVTSIPEAALTISEQRDMLVKYIGNLELLVKWYNKVKQTVLEVEYPLIRAELRAIDEQLQAAEETLTWREQSCWEYVINMKDTVHDLERRVQRAKDNMETIQVMMSSWSEHALFSRKENKTDTLLSLEDKNDRVAKRYKVIQESGERIHKLIEENLSLFSVDPSSDSWKAYVEYIDEMVVDGFFRAITCSLEFFIENTQSVFKMSPLFEAQMILSAPEITFKPSLDKEAGGGFYDLVEELLSAIYKMSAQMRRVAGHMGMENYQHDMDDMLDLLDMRQEIMDRVSDVIKKAIQYKSSFDPYAYLWVDDRAEFMKQFLLFGHVLTTEEIETQGDKMFPECPPSIEQFRDQIEVYEKLYTQISKFEDTKVFESWFRVDIKSFKISLLNTIKNLNELEEFMKVTDKALQKPVSKGDYKGLVEIMEFLLAVRDRQAVTDDLFEPLKETIALLEGCGQQMPDQVYTQLEAHMEIKLLEEQMIEMQESSNLFEVTVPDYRQLKQCRREIIILKGLWDIIIYVQSSIEDWTKTQWRQINVEQMDVELRRFAKEIRMLDKEVRGWDAYTGLDSTVKNLVTSLRAVTELQNSAIRERHWHQLMSTTGVKFTMNDDTTLTDLLALQLHRVEDEVRNIVDKAVKEMGIEKVLTEINQTWSTMEFSYEEHYRTRAPLLKSDEELIETLEDNQVQLQAILQSKYVEYFIEQVSSLQKKLTVADSVIFIWMEVQRTWSHLESIFIGSEDIRKQLPQDAKRFDGIDADFKELMFESAKTKNVIEATNKPNLFERLEDLQKRLSLCEKALAEYLETKRLAFPRFYFVSSADLLDILSKGTQPKEHIPTFPLDTTLARFKMRSQSGWRLVSRISSCITVKIQRIVMTICTIDVHARDVVAKLIAQKVTNSQAFPWLSQLRHRWDEDRKHCFANICDAQFQYSYEYLGNTPRLVITPLTDRCYITLTQSLHLTMSGAPAGPAGTGKTETTKDLGRALGVMVYVFNCSEQMDYKSIGNIYKGLAQTGAWGCFDEFNRISVEVLSVVAVQVKTIQDAIRNKRTRFLFLGEEIKLKPSVGIFITMNPGYAGRTELPENLKALFRQVPCAMVVPDIELICEIMLVAEGFLEARLLARKFITLYTLCRELLSKQLIDYRAEFSQWWTKEMKTVKFPSQGTVFDYYLDPQTRKFLHWNDKVPAFVMEPEASLQAVLVHTSETTRLRYFMDLLLERGKPVMLAGNAGVGKTALVGDRMGGLSEEYMVSNVPLNYYTTSAVLQKVLEKPLEKKAGRNYGPPGNKKLVYFIDDLNMPAVDAYGTVQAHTLIRQHMDYKHWYDRQKLTLKEIHNCQYVACMNPTAGSFTINSRLQRHFTVFAVNFPSADALEAIYSQILNFHFQQFAFNPAVVRTGSTVVQAAIWLHQKMVQNFLPTAIKFHYIFNLRDLSNIFQGVGDHILLQRPLIYCHFANGVGDPRYMPVKEWETLKRILVETLNSYNELNAAMNLVLFEDAMQHVCRISRILEASRGYALLVGVGGSGKQSLSRLAAYISSLDVFQVTLRKGYGIQDLRLLPCLPSRYVASWIDTRSQQSEKANLTILFDKYVPPCLELLRSTVKTITPIPENSMVQTLCSLLDCLLTPENVLPDSPRELYEIYFSFACIWAFGGAVYQDQLIDYRAEFSQWWTKEMKTVKFPSQGTVFDYYLDPQTRKFLHWNDKVPAFVMEPEASLQAVLVHTSETTRLRYFMDLLLERGKPVMLAGNAGVGKTALVGDRMGGLSEEYMVSNVPLNYYTTSAVLQKVLEKPLEKKAGRNYGPPGNKKLVYFIDDLNMPAVDAYGTVQAHTLIRQHMDYKHWYDRQKLTLKEIHNCQYVACMNPTAGSFTINSRLQRHFTVFAVNFPSADALEAIYSQILNFHFQQFAFSPAVVRTGSTVVQAAIWLHQKMVQNFLPTAIKFHYIFNLRDLSNIFQRHFTVFAVNFPSADALEAIYSQILNFHFQQFAFSPAVVRTGSTVVQAAIWLHQKMVQNFLPTAIKFHYIFNLRDLSNIFQGILFSAPDCLKQTADLVQLWLHESSRVYADKLVESKDSELFHKMLLDTAHKYFEGVGDHILLQRPLIYCHFANGVGDPRYMPVKEWETLKRILVETLNSYNELNAAMNLVLFEDAMQHVCRISRILEASRGYALLVGVGGSGKQSLSRLAAYISSLDVFQVTLRKGYGIQDLRVDLANLYFKTGAKNMPTVFLLTDAQVPDERFLVLINDLLASVGSTLRIRARKFPAVVNCTAIDWFHEWPQEALQSVSRRLIEEIEGIEVEELKAKLASQEVELNLKNQDAEALITKIGLQTEKVSHEKTIADAEEQKIGLQTEKVSREKTIADAEEQKVAAIQAEVSAKQKDCEDDLSKAEPALVAATAALNTLNKVNLTELKTFPNPPIAVTNVSAAVMALMAPRGKVPKDRSWKAAKIFMGKVDDFLQALIHYDKEHIPENCLKVVKEEYLKNPEFHPDLVRTKSFAASGLCAWVINIIRYYEVFCDVEPKRQVLSQANTDLDTATGKLETIRKKLVVFCDVEPKRQALSQANTDLDTATGKLETIRKKLVDLDANLRRLTTRFEKATAEKVRCQDEVTRTNRTIELANRLVKGLEVPIPLTEGLDPIGMLTDDATVAAWNNEGLPSDRMSTENATILTNCERWPLMIDPQQQGIKWIKNKYGSDLKVVCLGQKGYLDTIERAVAGGETVLIENLEETVEPVLDTLLGRNTIKKGRYLDTIERAVAGGETVLIENLEETVEPVLDTLLGRNTIKKGRYIRIGDKECKYSSRFRLILHTKLANPHYKPEMQAQSTLINFTVTRDGLEEQLLAEVVSTERPDLEKLKSELTKQQNDFKIELKRLEDELLTRLSAAKGSFLGDTVLVEKLETTKLTAAEIECKVFEAKENEIKINEAREFYRPAAERASVLYFIINDLSKINPMYQFSLKTFNIVFHKAIERAEKCDEVQERVVSLKDCITYSVFLYTSRGLFERDKLTFLSQTAFQILLINKAIDPQELDFLLRFNIELSSKSPVHFLSSQAWSAIKTMSMWDGFRGLDRDIEGSAKRWKKLVESECPEREKFPQEWKNKSSLQKLIMLRALRPDRMTYAVRNYVEENMGSKYVEGARMEFAKSYEESSPATPVFFILSAGVNPLKDVESLGKKLGFTIDLGKLHNVSLGQGQEVVAEKALEKASREGHWVILQNVHLVAKWLGTLQKLLEKYSEGSHPDYRVFISAEPAATPDEQSIPQGILENSIKITNEPPTGMLANLHAALYNFDQVPWEDLCYLFGEIMYGGHITDDWDRRLCHTYLEEFMHPDMLEGELFLAPGFVAPPNLDYVGYHKYVDDVLPPESPVLYGLHPNAEIEFLTVISDNLFRTILEMQPRDLAIGEGSVQTAEEKVKNVLDDILEKLPEKFNMNEIMLKTSERTPYIVVCFQECERMNLLIHEIRRSLKELDLGLKVSNFIQI